VFLPPGSYDLALTGGETFVHTEILDGGSAQPAVVIDAGAVDIYIGLTRSGYSPPSSTSY